MIKFLKYSIAATFVSLFLYPFAFWFYPALYTKNYLAVIGIIFFTFNSFRNGIKIRKDLFFASCIALTYTLINIAVYLNFPLADTSYAFYFQSFIIWFFSGYAVVSCINWANGKASIRNITIYMALVSAFQCIMALIIDSNEPIKLIVDTYIIQGAKFFDEVDRLYGIGAALDNGGIRFALTLIMISFVLIKDKYIHKSTPKMLLLLFSFMIIGMIGNMISRTTTTGLVLALISLIMGSGIYRLTIKTDIGKLYVYFFAFLSIGIVIMTFLYNTDPYYYKQLRFAFEGFFNLFEGGEFRTDSTDKLNNTMWKWPETLEGWLIGTGRFDGFAFGTDVGYCRLILYSGLPAFSIFVGLFVYSAINFYNTYPRYKLMFLLFMAMTFIIWIKVATDIFFMYALFYSFYDDEEYMAIDENEQLRLI